MKQKFLSIVLSICLLVPSIALTPIQEVKASSYSDLGFTTSEFMPQWESTGEIKVTDVGTGVSGFDYDHLPDLIKKASALIPTMVEFGTGKGSGQRYPNVTEPGFYNLLINYYFDEPGASDELTTACGSDLVKKLDKSKGQITPFLKTYFTVDMLKDRPPETNGGTCLYQVEYQKHCLSCFLLNGHFLYIYRTFKSDTGEDTTEVKYAEAFHFWAPENFSQPGDYTKWASTIFDNGSADIIGSNFFTSKITETNGQGQEISYLGIFLKCGYAQFTGGSPRQPDIALKWYNATGMQGSKTVTSLGVCAVNSVLSMNSTIDGTDFNSMTNTIANNTYSKITSATTNADFSFDSAPEGPIKFENTTSNERAPGGLDSLVKLYALNKKADKGALDAEGLNVASNVFNSFRLRSVSSSNDVKDLIKHMRDMYPFYDQYFAFMDSAISEANLDESISDWLNSSATQALETFDGDKFELFELIYAYGLLAYQDKNKDAKASANDCIMLDGTAYTFDTNKANGFGGNTKNLYELFDELNPYQQASIYETHKVILRALKDAGKDTSYCTWLSSKTVDTSTLTFSDPSDYYDGDMSIKLDDYVRNASTSGAALIQTSTISYENILALYAWARSFYGQTNPEETNSLFSFYNSDLETVLATMPISNSEDTRAPVFATTKFLPKECKLLEHTIKDLKEGDTSAEGNGVEYIYQVLYNTAAAFEISNHSEYGEKWGLSSTALPESETVVGWAESIDNFGAYVETVNMAEDDFKATQKNLERTWLLAILSLHDLCQDFGIPKDAWTDSIKHFLDIYDTYADEFEAFRKNPSVYTESQNQESTVEEPLAKFFSVKTQSMDSKWVRGYAQSAEFLPLVTNVYDASTYSSQDSKWITDFYYRYGFHRKALFIDNDVYKASKNVMGVDSMSGRSVATLADLLNPERDITLYIDDNFYNADEVKELLGKITPEYVAEQVQQTAEENVEETVVDDGSGDASKTVSSAVEKTSLLNLLSYTGSDQLLKTGNSSTYSDEIAMRLTEYGKGTDKNVLDEYVMTSEDIVTLLNDYNYSPMQSYAVVSAIYRQSELFNQMQTSLAVDTEIFQSSRSAAQIEGAGSNAYNAFYNYLYLKNLSNIARNSADITLDMSAPLYVDIFGNIVTQGGLVVVPAVTNATYNTAYWAPFSIGFSSSYYSGEPVVGEDLSKPLKNFLVTGDANTDYTPIITGENANTVSITHANGGGWFTFTDDDKLVLKDSIASDLSDSVLIQWNRLAKDSDQIKMLFYNNAYYNNATHTKFSKLAYLTTEVLRGAPISNIDLEKEHLEPPTTDSASEVYAAYILELFIDKVFSSKIISAIFAIPNPAYLSSTEILAIYLMKFAMLGLLIYMTGTFVVAAIKNRLSIMGVVKSIGILAFIIITFKVVPDLVAWSYNSSNALLLRDEISYVSTLDYTKSLDNTEIKMTQVSTSSADSDIYLQVADLNVPWYSIFGDVMTSDIGDTLSSLYAERASENIIAQRPDVIIKSNKGYMNVMDLYDSTRVSYSPRSGILYNVETSNKPVEEVASVSYVTPYYYFLDALVADVNNYNISQAVKTTSYAVSKKGSISTYDICAPYFTSNLFMENDYDILSLAQLYGTTSKTYLQYNNILQDPKTFNACRSSYWFTPDMDPNLAYDKITQLYEFAHKYVANSQHTLTQVPDEVYLKSFALRLAIEYNRLFNVPVADSYEVFNINPLNLLRFIIGDEATVYKGYSLSLARYTFQESGLIGTLLMLTFILVAIIASAFKPLVLMLLIILLVFSMLFQDTSKGNVFDTTSGFFVSIAGLIFINFGYALLMKLSMSLPKFNIISPILALVLSIILQAGYLSAMFSLILLVSKDFRHVGSNAFKTAGRMFVENVHIKTHHNTYHNSNTSTTGSDLYQRMIQQKQVDKSILSREHK